MLETRQSKMVRRNRRRPRGNCRGSAIVELTAAIPLLIMVVFAGIEASNAIYLQQTVTDASYQGALMGMRAWSNEAAVTNSVQQMLQARGITGAQVEVIGANGTAFDNLVPGQLFRVEVEVPAQENSLAATFSGRNTGFGSISHATRQ